MGGVKRDDITSENCELLSYEQGSYDSTSLGEEGGKGKIVWSPAVPHCSKQRRW